MLELSVDLGQRSYPIFIGADLLTRFSCFTSYIKGKKVAVVTNETIAPLYLETLKKTLAGYELAVEILPDGESWKTLNVLERIFDCLLTNCFDRQSTLIALGGGVVGDMTGFAAACYQRGVDFIQVPTTLLSQVDSSVGGKTGVNHPLGKNMIGAFYQPEAVVIDTHTLQTLPDRELSAGIAEVIKYGLIGDSKFYQWLHDNMDKLLAKEPASLAYAIEQSCRNKAKVVAADEMESGIRAILNLGHTFGHAIETTMGYGQWLHGEAVAAGTVMAADLSTRLGWLTQAETDHLVALLKRANLPVLPPQGMTPSQFLDAMMHDKKVLNGRLRLVLLERIGQAVVTAEFDFKCLEATLNSLCHA